MVDGLEGRSPSEFPLGAEQRRFLFLHQLNPASPEIYITCIIHVRGRLDVPAVRQALAFVVQRHDVLRATFQAVHGDVVHRVRASAPVELQVVGLTGYPVEQRNHERRKLVAAEAEVSEAFDLSRGPPFKFTLVQLGGEENDLIVRFHHIVCDFLSVNLFFHEFAGAYGALARGGRLEATRPAPQFAQFVAQERQREQLGGMAQSAAYWQKQLAGASETLELPTDRVRPVRHTRRAGSRTLVLDGAAYSRVLERGRHEAVTPFMTLFAAFAALLFRFSGQRDILIGSPIASREDAASKQMLGVLINWILPRMKMDATATLADVLRDTRQTLIDAYEHRHGTIDQFLRGLKHRDPSRNPLFQALFDHVRTPGNRVQSGDVDLEIEYIPWTHTHFDLAFAIEEHGTESAEARLNLVYYADIFSPKTADRILRSYARVLDQIAMNPSVPVATLELEAKLPLASVRVPALPEFKISIASTFGAAPLQRTLAFWAEKLGTPWTVNIASEDQVLHELLDPGRSLSTNQRGMNVLLVRPEDLVGPQSTDELVLAARSIAKRSLVPMLVALCPPSGAALEVHTAERLAEAEASLRDRLSEGGKCRVIASSELIAAHGALSYDDPAGFEHARTPYLPAFYASLASAVARAAASRLFTPKKVLVVDCDNTLWGGACGDEGAKGVRLSEPYLAVQRLLQQKAKAGMLICLCSKNGEADVLEVFRTREDMILRLEDVVATRINWEPKSHNIASLALELGLGLDAFVFIDDNPIECAEVERNCPEVTVACLPSSVDDISEFLTHYWPLDIAFATAEDQARTQFYRQNRAREQARANATFKEFLANLQLDVTFSPLLAEHMGRAAQMTVRTNQFNLTTVRRTEAELTRLLSEGCDGVIAGVRDRFGDYGHVGLLLFQDGEDISLTIDTFLLSCRALGRGVEHAMLLHVLEIARNRGCAFVNVPVVTTDKNEPARRFLQSVGAQYEVRGESGGGRKVYRFPMDARVVFETEEVEPPQSIKAGAAAPLPPVRSILWNEIATALSTGERVSAAVDASRRTARPASLAPHAAPTTRQEAILVRIWQNVLGLEPVSIDDDYFELGGDSIQAVEISARAREEGVHITLSDLLEHPNIRSVAARSRADVARVDLVKFFLPGRPANLPSALQTAEDVYPLASTQAFMVRKYEEENLRRPSPTGAYHFQVSVKAESADIPIAPAILREAVELVAARQHVLRSTVFDHETGRMQALHLARAVDFELIDASGCTGPEQDAFIDKLMAADRRSPVDLRADNAVFRIKVVQWSPNAVDAVFACHHGFGDGWGGHELLSNVFRVYESLSAGNRAELDRRLASAGPKNNVYKEFVALEESQWRDERAKKFWEQYLGEIAHARFDTISSVFPTDAPAPIVRSVDPSIVARLNEFSRSRRLSMRAILLSAYLDVVQRLTPDEPTAIGVVTNGRSERLSDPLGAFGLLWQFLPVAVPGVKGAVAKAHAVHERLRTVEALGGYPLHRLLHEAGRPEPFSATFSFVRFPNAPWAAHDIKLGVRRRKTFDRYHFPLNASLEALGEAPASSVIRSTVPNLRATFTYSPLHFHEESIERVASSFLAKLSEIAGTF